MVSEVLAAPAVPPERTADQRMAALKRGNEIRTARSRLKKDLRRLSRAAAAVDLAERLADPAVELLTCKVFDLLLAVPGYGRVKVNRLLMTVQMSPSKTVGGMSVRQRVELAGILRGLARV